jgi:hypothetical protein
MQISYGKQIDVDELKGQTIDLFILAANHERRVYTALNKIKSVSKVVKSIALCYKEPLPERETDEVVLISNHLQVVELLENEINSFREGSLNIVVDYSCMTKSWYYTIILYLSMRELDVEYACVNFVYTPSKFSEPQLPKPNTEIAPLPGKYIVPTDKPKALIVCLGYEHNKAEGIIEHLDPKISYLFYTKPALDKRFVGKLEENNKNLLENSNNIVTYPFDDMLFLERKLTAIYLMLKDKYSIIIAPLGPKPFTFIAMMMAAKYSDIDIWRVGSGSDINEYPREAISENTFLISKVVWIKS